MKAVDFLTAPFRDGEGIERTGDKFILHRPWARARLSGLQLSPGWWTLECHIAGGAGAVEVQLGCASDPLIVLHGRNAGAENIYLQDAGPYDVSLLLSPWPGEVHAKRIRLRRLSGLEALRRIAAGAGRVLRNPNRLELISRIGKRLIAGQALGMRSATPPVVSPAAPAAAAPAAAETSGVEHVETWSGVRVVLGPGDKLDPRAGQIVADAFAASPAVQALYCDARQGADIIVREGWDPERARWHDFAGLPVFFREAAWRPSEPAWDQLKAIALSSGAAAIARIPLPLVEQSIRPRPVLTPAPQPVLARTPTVSIVIPTKVRLDLLKKCLAGLSACTDYPGMDVVIIDNGADLETLNSVLDEARRTLKIAVVADRGDFNFSRLINTGVKATIGEIVVILNDDVEPLHPGWLHRMVESAMVNDVGAVGARLIYPDGSIQHAGVTLGVGGVCGHLRKGTSAAEAEHVPQIIYPGSRMAVTGACLALRREAFDAVGGFDEALPVALNDIDFCLRLHDKGYRNIYRGDAVLIHHESQSRGPDDLSSQSRRRLATETSRFLARWRLRIESDPFGSPAFDPQVEHGAPNPILLEMP